MTSQIQLNTIKLSILSLSREKSWLFTNSILQLLYHSIEEYKDEDEVNCNNQNNLDDSDNDYDDEYSSSSISSYESDENLRKSIDNTSKIKIEDKTENQDQDDLFFHISYTPCEVTIICSKRLMSKLFSNPIQLCKELNFDDVELIEQDFLSLIVESDGSFDKSLRILELTKPLSENNISLFYLSSHFNDIVLFPIQFKNKVVKILHEKFEFETAFDFDDDDDISAHELNELEIFEKLKKNYISPIINERVKLLLTGSRSNEVKNSILKIAKILSTTNLIPKYFTITRTSFTELSLILPKSTKKRAKLGFDAKYIIGSVQDTIIPITIDLHQLPIDTTGIVASLANKLIKNGDNLIELNYFSMAKSGIIMVPIENLELVSSILKNI
ncbi:unnamed protein product [Candida verbasci]|uniref:CASTOR ACT domain-containing protein n=1 Tax=Candida verbasci TaxID=1227364 RepID=A0A9W4XB86_9ASCO|nr:unnamed protein product [Candida verbasci]